MVFNSFRNHFFRRPRKLFEGLARDQRPEVLFITCSDSRVDPNLITHTEPGSLFILCNAGNLVPPHGAAGGSEAAAIEYATSELQVKDIIVCGHSCCGAMDGLLNPQVVAKMPAITSWLAQAEPVRHRIRARYKGIEEHSLLKETIEQNVLVQMENLRTHPSVADRLSTGDIGIHGWVYRIETGEVEAFDSGAGRFVPLSERRLPSLTFLDNMLLEIP
jgi:carbonic anhydrase